LGGQCNTCSNGCNSCQDRNTCTSCYDPNSSPVNGFCLCNDPNASYQPGSNVCTCNGGYFLGTDGKCQACGYGCSTCTAAAVCKACWDQAHMTLLPTGACQCIDDNKVFSPTSELCVCKPGSYLSVNSCLPCDLTCANCISGTDCSTCQDANNMVNNGDGTCSCIKHHNKFSNSKNTCVEKSGAVSLSLAWLWLVILGTISGFLI